MSQFYFNPDFVSAGTLNKYYKFAIVLDDGTCFAAIRQHGIGTKTRAQSFKVFEKSKHVGSDAYNFDTDFKLVKSLFENNHEAREFIVYAMSHFQHIIRNCDFKDRHHLAVRDMNHLLERQEVFAMLHGEESAEESESVQYICQYIGTDYYGLKHGSFYPVDKIIADTIVQVVNENGQSVSIGKSNAVLYQFS